MSDIQKLNVNTVFGLIRDQLSAFMGFSHEGQRDLFRQFGYKRELLFEDYVAVYRRNPIAARIIRAFPQATWKDCPQLSDDENKESEDSPFEKAWQNFYEAMKLSFYFERADRMCGLGRYSVLLLGFQNGALESPLSAGNNPLLYLSPYSERNSKIVKWELDEKNPRFGMPVIYQLQKGNPFNTGRPTAQSKSIRVHYSRVLHIAEMLDDDEVFGTPRLECSYNQLRDIEKVSGSSAETFWLNARQGLAFNADKDVRLSDGDIADMKIQAEEFEHQLRRNIAMRGVKTQVLNAMIADPSKNVDSLLDLIAGGQGMPKRILVGSERGELASSQDESNWSSRIDERRNGFATPTVLKPFITCMISTGNLPEPKTADYTIIWPEIAAQSPGAKAEVALHRAQAIKAYASTPGAELIVPVPEFRESLGLEAESDYNDDTTEPPPLDENDPNVQTQFSSTHGGKTADLAMNGLQVSGLQAILVAVSADELAPEAAVIMITACFPMISAEDAKAMVDAQGKIEPPAPPPQIMPPGPNGVPPVKKKPAPAPAFNGA